MNGYNSVLIYIAKPIYALSKLSIGSLDLLFDSKLSK
ncbi:hypothetical protein SAMN06265337_4237 [Hymenobacter gelipurpurascens]|uniref:Uncharacterized protein n=1 Tax=Hymenobacter gelipurpurascens TaxID=89968 RepID=A0A212UHA5_9BACT|nr:hypothetical protein SAMN06265337_4237 [Hymenobacter gelipurpurascens]